MNENWCTHLKAPFDKKKCTHNMHYMQIFKFYSRKPCDSEEILFLNDIESSNQHYYKMYF